MMDQKTDDDLVKEMAEACDILNHLIGEIAERGLHCDVDLINVDTIHRPWPPLISVMVERRERLGSVGLRKNL
jgi:hypothetical protein